MDEELIKKYSSHLERAAWCQVFLGMLSQVSTAKAFPSYNVVLGFWGAYCAFSKHGRATFGLICFQLLSLLLDIIFSAVNSDADDSASFKFALTMFIFCIFAKLAALYSASHFFSAIGGAYSMNNSGNVALSAYDSMMYEEGRNSSGDNGTYYDPPGGHHRGTPLSNSESADDIGPRVMLQSSDDRSSGLL
jgi:hypothetical protein